MGPPVRYQCTYVTVLFLFALIFASSIIVCMYHINVNLLTVSTVQLRSRLMVEGQVFSTTNITIGSMIKTGKNVPVVSDLQGPGTLAVSSPVIISRLRGVEASCDVRGNLGPCSVILQGPPGTDWLKDRWQAASDMGGTAIPGAHWVIIDFKALVNVYAMVLDWETAFAKDYRIYGRAETAEKWVMFYDGGAELEMTGKGIRETETFGQSPGVKTKMPLHVVHTLNWTNTNQQSPSSGENPDWNEKDARTLRYMRIYIAKPAVGWGVSLWQVDVTGVYVADLRQLRH